MNAHGRAAAPDVLCEDRRRELQRRLGDAIGRRELELHFQPRMQVASGQIIGAEALVRWRLPGQGLIPPDRFIGLAERSGLIVPIGTWVLRHACLTARGWQREGLASARISVNVSREQLLQGDLPQTIRDVLLESELAARCLELELSQAVLLQAAPRLIETLEELRQLGVSCSIDEFGTDAATLARLRHCRLARLKVGRRFIRNLASDLADAARVRSMIELGHGLGLQVVAEGVESAQQIEFLRRHGCDEMQGYHLGRPVIETEFRSLIRAQVARAL